MKPAGASVVAGLEGTLSSEEAARRAWDIVVVGAGPAGCAAALTASRAGASVLLVEKERFPREKVCGSCLHPRGLGRLESMGLRATLDSAGAVRATSFRIRTCGHETVLPLAREEGEGYRILSRAVLDAALARRAIEEGCAFLPGVRVTDSRRSSAASGPIVLRGVAGSGPLELSASVVVLATGLGGASGSRFGIPDAVVRPGSRIGAAASVEDLAEPPPPGEIRMLVGRDGYVGICRLEDGSIHAAAAVDPRGVRRGGIGEAVARIAAEAERGEPSPFAHASWIATPPLTRRLARHAGPRLLVAGDAAGYVEPFTGEGMTWALESGVLAGEAAARAARDGWSATLATRFEREWRRRVGAPMRRCRRVARLVRHPRPLGWVLGGVRRLPTLAARAAGLFVSSEEEERRPDGVST